MHPHKYYRKPSSGPHPSLLKGRIAIITIEGKEFYVHEDLINFYAEYFHGALTGVFKEGGTGKVTLQEEDVDVFTCFYHWLYNGIIFPEPEHMPDEDEWRSGPFQPRQRLLYNCWIFGDARQAPAFQNEALNELRDVMLNNWNFNKTCMSHFYCNTLKSAKPREFLKRAVVMTG